MSWLTAHMLVSNASQFTKQPVRNLKGCCSSLPMASEKTQAAPIGSVLHACPSAACFWSQRLHFQTGHTLPCLQIGHNDHHTEEEFLRHRGGWFGFWIGKLRPITCWTCFALITGITCFHLVWCHVHGPDNWTDCLFEIRWFRLVRFTMIYVLDGHTSSTAKGVGGSFKVRKPIWEARCCEWWMAE